MNKWIGVVLFTVAAMAAVPAQTESVLQEAFEGRKVIVKLDMPGSSDGVDVSVLPGGRGRVDYGSYGSRLKRFGTAIQDGDTATITKVKVKGKHIEFQLDGGGFGTFGDDSNPYVGWTPCSKSGRETDLEKRLDNETNPYKRDQIKSELNDLRWRREREDDRRRAQADEASREKAVEIRENRMRGGSRFNLNFGGKPGASDLTVETVTGALSEYVIFPWQQGGDPRERQNAGDGPVGEVIRPSRASADLEKGMSLEDVEVVLGAPVSEKDIPEGSLKVHQCVYETGKERITADFIDGTLIRYSVASR